MAAHDAATETWRTAVQFLDPSEVFRELNEFGVKARPEGELVRYALEPTPATGSSVSRLLIAPDAKSRGDHDRAISAPLDQLPQIIERLFHKVHVNEVILTPVGAWRAVLEIALFDLAEDEDWLEVDAEASLHQNRRDPLLVGPNNMHILQAFAKAIIEHGAKPEENLTMIALGFPLIVELTHEGAIEVWCAGEAFATELADVV